MATKKSDATQGGDGWSAEERAAMKQRSQEVRKRKGKTTPEEDLAAAEAAIAEMDGVDHAVASRIHELVLEHAPELAARTWYGFPAYAKDGKVVCFYQPGAKFKTRYGTLGFQDPAQLDDGPMWATAFAVIEVDAAVGKRIVELLRRAVG